MKKLLSLILALAMIFTLAACGTTDGGSASTDTSGSTDDPYGLTGFDMQIDIF